MSGLIFTNATLGRDEEILFSASPHWARFVKPVLGLFLSCAVIVIGSILKDYYILGMGGVFFIPAFFSFIGQMNIEIVCTNRRVIYKRGAYWFKTQELRLAKIESVYVWQPLAAGLVGCGSIYFTGTGGTELVFKYVKDPVAAKTAFEDIIDEVNGY